MAKRPRSTALVEVLFLGPTHRLEAFGQFVARGTSALFTEAEVFALRADDRIQIEVLDAPKGESTTGGDTSSEPEAISGEGHHESHEQEE